MIMNHVSSASGGTVTRLFFSTKSLPSSTGLRNRDQFLRRIRNYFVGKPIHQRLAANGIADNRDLVIQRNSDHLLLQEGVVARQRLLRVFMGLVYPPREPRHSGRKRPPHLRLFRLPSSIRSLQGPFASKSAIPQNVACPENGETKAHTTPAASSNFGW
jgi:hypothetical protein